MKSSIEQFEDWFNGTMKPAMEKHIASFNDINVSYVASWHAWQASREAIEIELPGSFRESYQSTNMVIDEQETIERIESQGLKVKS